MAAPSFYNQGDQAIYESGQHYVPQEKYRLGYTAPTVEEEKITESFGIPYTNAFTGSGGGGGGGGGGPTGDLINNFNTATGNRQYNLNNPNKVQGFVNKFMTPQRSVNEMTSAQDLNFGRNEFNDETLSYDRTNMPANPDVDVRKSSGLPFGIGAMIARGLPDKYYDMNLADQAYTQANMGYTGPTVFGENTTGLSQDPFGRNVRSALGNYGEAQQKSIDKMDERMGTESFTDKYGSGLSLEEDDDGNWSYVGPGAAYANKMNKMNLAKYSFDKRGLSERDLINKNINNQKRRRAAYEDKTRQELDAADTAFVDTGDYDEYAGAGGTPNYSIPDTNDPGGGGGGYSEARNTAGIQSAEDDMKDGGRAGYFFGGRAGFAKGGRQDQMGGTMEQTASELRAAAPDQFGGGMNINQGGDNNGGIKNIITNNTNGSNFIDTSNLISRSPEVSVNYSPAEWAAIRGRLFNTNLKDNDDIETEANISGKLGNFNYDVGINQLGDNNYNLGYENNIKGWDVKAATNLQDTASLSASKNGWGIDLTQDPQGTNAMVNKTWSWGQPEQTYNTLSLQEEDPNLIYGQNLRNGGLAGLL